MFAALLLACVAIAQPAATPNTDKQIAAANKLAEQLTTGEFDKVPESFNLTMKLLLSTAQLRAAWDGTTSVYGKFERIGESRAVSVDTYVIVFVTLEFARGKLDTKVAFDQNNRVTGLFFVPHGNYQTPDYVAVEKLSEIEVQIGKGFFPLSGTLTLPKGDGPFPSVVLVHGSGPNDRDEAVGPNKPFRDLAHGLASQGIAVLRYEKRTRQYGLAMAVLSSSITVKGETIDDAVAAVDLLAAREKIDPKRIFVLGHSLGGYLLPRIIAAQPKIAGGVSLAGSTRPMEDLILEQTRYLLSLDGPPNADLEKQVQQLEQQIAKVKSPDLDAKTMGSELPLGVPASYWLDLRDYDPAAAAKELKVPLLILQGERDYQVTLADFARWKEALADNPNAKLITYPQLNHLFMPGKGKSTPVEYLTPGNVDEHVVRDISEWVLKMPARTTP